MSAAPACSSATGKGKYPQSREEEDSIERIISSRVRVVSSSRACCGDADAKYRGGRGLVLDGDRGAVAGDVLLEERPLCAMQEADNRISSACCAFCHAFVGDLDLQIDFLLQRENGSGACSTSNGGAGGNVSFPELDSCPRTLTEMCLPCSKGCGAFYCSESCRAEHWRRSHRLLCVGGIEDNNHPLVKFKMHALGTNDIFLLAAEVVCTILTDVIDGRSTLDEATKPYKYFERGPWWETSSGGDDELAAQMRGLVEDSCQLLSEALRPYSYQAADLFDPQEYGSIVGGFELNNIGISVPSPLLSFASEAARLPPGGQQEAARAKLVEMLISYLDLKEAVERDEADPNAGLRPLTPPMENCAVADDSNDFDDDDGDDQSLIDARAVLSDTNPSMDELLEVAAQILPSFEGTGLYTTACMMNHSCDPNVETVYAEDGRGPVIGRVVARRDINPGEELFQTYIDEDMDLNERQGVLRDNYGFTCRCARCEAGQ